MPVHTQPPEGFESSSSPGERSYLRSPAAARDDEISLPRDGILLIDDSDDDAELSLRALAKLGLALPVAWLKDSVRALEALVAAEASALPRLILLDLHMPRVDGFEVLQKVKQNTRTARMCVIVMVGSARTPELERCVAAGADAYVVKPLNRDSVLAACERAALRLS
jgi:two-component system, response regulator